MGEDCLVYVIGGINIDAPHQLDELTRLRQVVAAGLVESLADEVKGHFM